MLYNPIHFPIAFTSPDLWHNRRIRERHVLLGNLYKVSPEGLMSP